MAISTQAPIPAGTAGSLPRPETPKKRIRVNKSLGLNPRFFVTRILGALFSIWGVVTLVFFMLQATGSPATFLIGGSGTREDLDRINAFYAFNRPVWERYFRFLANRPRANFPDPIRSDTSLMFILGPAIGYTLVLTTTAIVLGVIIGLLAGYYAAFGKIATIKHAALTVI